MFQQTWDVDKERPSSSSFERSERDRQDKRVAVLLKYSYLLQPGSGCDFFQNTATQNLAGKRNRQNNAFKDTHRTVAKRRWTFSIVV